MVVVVNKRSCREVREIRELGESTPTGALRFRHRSTAALRPTPSSHVISSRSVISTCRSHRVALETHAAATFGQVLLHDFCAHTLTRVSLFWSGSRVRRVSSNGLETVSVALVLIGSTKHFSRHRVPTSIKQMHLGHLAYCYAVRGYSSVDR